MRERSRTARAKTAILLVASIFALALLAPNASAAPFPDRKSSSYGATSFLAYAAGQLQAGGWHTETLPYSTVVKVESAREKTVLLVVAEGHNLLALENGSVKALDCLLVAPYDNVFRDNPEAPEGDSFTGASWSMALDIAAKLNTECGYSFGVALVSGHYQHGAGARALVRTLNDRGIRVKSCVVLGDIRQFSGIPLVASPDTRIALVEGLMEGIQAAGLTVHMMSPWTLDLAATPRGYRGVSPETLTGVTVGGEHDVFAESGIPVVTVGLPSSNPLAILEPAAAPAENVEARADLVAGAVSTVLNKLETAGEQSATVGDMQLVRLFGKARFAAPGTFLFVGVAVALLLAVTALTSIPKDLSSLALAFGTTAASAVSLLLSYFFTRRSATSYASDLYPAGATSLFFVLFALLLLMAVLRLWSIRSRIRHLHVRVAGDAGPGGSSAGLPAKTTWGSAWSLAVLSALCLGASLSRSELTPSILVAGTAHGLATLCCRIRDAGGRPHSALLWVSRALYVAPMVAVFWAGNPFARDIQRIYRSAWTGLNQGSVVSVLALSAAAASILSTLEFPKPAPAGALTLLTLSEVAVLGLVLAAGFLLPASSRHDIPTWAVFSESYGADTRVSIAAPAPVTEIELQGAPEDMPDRLRNPSGVAVEKVGDRQEVSWADLSLAASSPPGVTGPKTIWSAEATFNKEPDAVLLRLRELGTRMSTYTGFEISINPELLTGCDETPAAIGERFNVPPGYSAVFMWWKPTAFPTRHVELDLGATVRIEGRLQAIYLDQSYMDVLPVVEGVRFYRMTSVEDGAL